MKIYRTLKCRKDIANKGTVPNKYIVNIKVTIWNI